MQGALWYGNRLHRTELGCWLHCPL